MGIHVEHRPKDKILSEARGLWPFKKIVVGADFARLEPRCQGAALLHEVGHVKLFHLEKRIAFAILNFWRPAAIARYCREQEFQADAFAAGCGYGLDLALLFARLNEQSDPFHPSVRERIERLTRTLAGMSRC